MCGYSSFLDLASFTAAFLAFSRRLCLLLICILLLVVPLLELGIYTSYGKDFQLPFDEKSRGLKGMITIQTNKFANQGISYVVSLPSLMLKHIGIFDFGFGLWVFSLGF